MSRTVNYGEVENENFDTTELIGNKVQSVLMPHLSLF